jgi:hypothetical protein
VRKKVGIYIGRRLDTFLPGEKRPLGVNIMIEGGAKGKSSVKIRAPW